MRKKAATNNKNGAKRGKARVAKAANAQGEITLEEKLRAIAAKVPKREWKKIPKDLVANLDHYLYGFPKRS